MGLLRWLLGHLMLIMLIAALAFVYLNRQELGLVAEPVPAPAASMPAAPPAAAPAQDASPVTEAPPAEPTNVQSRSVEPTGAEPPASEESSPAAPVESVMPAMQDLPLPATDGERPDPIAVAPARLPAATEWVYPELSGAAEPAEETAEAGVPPWVAASEDPNPPAPVGGWNPEAPVRPLTDPDAASAALPPPPSDATLVPTDAAAPPSLPQRLDAARQAYWQGRFDAAEVLYLELLAELDEDPRLLGELAAVQVAAQQPHKAADTYARAALLLVEQGRSWEIPPLLNQVFALDYRRGLALERELAGLQPAPVWR